MMNPVTSCACEGTDGPSILSELRQAAQRRGIINVSSVATIDLVRYVQALRTGGSVERWSLARQRMYNHELRQLGVSTARENPISTPVKTGIIVAGVVFIAGLVYAMTTKSASAATSLTPIFVTDPVGGQAILLTPGNMGSINVVSSASSSPTSAVQPQIFNILAPSGGRILNVASSNTNVLSSMAGSTLTAEVALGSALLPGTTIITVSWSLNGAQQTSSFVVIAN
jgi:hypothetical protein